MDPARDHRADPRATLSRSIRRRLRPPRTLRPTRAGWIFFVLTFGVAFAALNTGNNLLYLALSLMLAFLALSGVFSEAALRGIRVARHLPREIFANEPTHVRLEVVNTQRRVPAFAIAVEDRVRENGASGVERAAGRVFLLRIGPREAQHGAYRFVASRRGEAVFSGFRVSTRFPFGLFQKALTQERTHPALIYPALATAPEPRARDDPSRSGDSLVGRSGAGSEAGGLREFVEGDSARRIQWRASLRRGSLVVRDVEKQPEPELEVELRTRGRSEGRPFERDVSRAATEVAAGLARGSRVALKTDATRMAAGAGPRHRARLLAFLARVQPGGAASGTRR